MVYGACLFFSDEANGCSKTVPWEMILIGTILFFGALKVIILIIACITMTIVISCRKLKKRNERSASRDILRKLSKIKYSALEITQRDTDEECSICFTEYADDCYVSRLDCNEKHLFH
mmetsp:Transcript_19037/g.25760  ORF Transcript_19037/g.25760 Transcript_19037/m.25760 type:complete len:118 (-) Transcript_19037:123-476(-)